LPDFLRNRLAIVKEEAKNKFKPLALLDALLWCLSLIQKSININELQKSIQALRQQKLFTDLPAVSNQQIEDGLSWLGGFVRSLSVGFEKRWQLQHEILGQWFCEQHGRAENLPSLRLSLVKFGAVPLPEKASEAEFGQWLEWMKAGDYEHYGSLASELQVSVLESLSTHLPEKEADHALVLKRLDFVLSMTEEQQRVSALKVRFQEWFEDWLKKNQVQIKETICVQWDYLKKKEKFSKAKLIKALATFFLTNAKLFPANNPTSIIIIVITLVSDGYLDKLCDDYPKN
jgi:hypothetical protein